MENLLNRLPMPAIILTRNGALEASNPLFLETFGYSHAAFSDLQGWFEACCPDTEYRDRALVEWEEALAALARGEASNPTFEVVTRNEDLRTIQFHVSEVKDDTLLVILQDNTERTRAERDLRKSEERYRMVAETADDVILTHDISGRLLYINPKGVELLGYEADDLLSMNILELCTAEDRKSAQERYHGRMDGDTSIYQYITTLTASSGEQIPLEVRSTMTRDEDGELIIQIIGRDIRERLEEESRLQESEERYRQLFRRARDVLLVADRDTGVIIDANAAAEEFLGYTRSELIGKFQQDLHPRPRREEFKALFYSVSKDTPNGLKRHAPIEFLRADGSQAYAEGSSALVTVGGRTMVLGIFRDVSERETARTEMEVLQQRVRSFAERTPMGIYFFELNPDDQLIFIGSNPAADRIIGIDHSERIGKDINDAFPGLRNTDLLGYYMRAVKEAIPYDNPDVLYTLFDPPRIFEVHAFQNAPRQLAVMFQDVTSRKQAEMAVRKLSSAVEQSSASVIITDKSGVIEYVNPATLRYSGYSGEELLGENVRMLASGETDETIFKNLWETILRGQPWSGEMLNMRKSGERYWVLASIYPILNDENETTHFVAISEDVTEQRAARDMLRESEARFRGIVESSFDGMFIFQDGHFRLVNGSIETLFGYSREELLDPGFDIFGLVADESIPFIQQEMQILEGDFTQEPARTRVLKGRKRNGESLELFLSTSVVDWDGAPAVLGVVHNVTDIRRLEEQLNHAQKMDAVGRLAGGVAHDFNNLLTGIIGHAELASAQLHDQHSAQRDLNDILDTSERAADLVRQLLVFSRKKRIVPQHINVNTSLESMERMLQRIIGEDIALSVNLADAIKPVSIDPSQFEQVIVNLVVNGRDAMPAGGKLAITTELRSSAAHLGSDREGGGDGAWVVVTVSDTGIGMKREVRDRIFEPFFTTKPEGKGTGLGLATVFGVLQQSNGRIEVESEEGKGTTFTIYLPAAVGVFSEKKEREAGTRTRGGETILIVEDEAAVRDMALRSLQNFGYRTFAVSSGAEAIKMIDENNDTFDLLLTDVVMPGLSGPDLVHQVRKMRPDLRVLFMSGYSRDALGEDDLKAEGMGYIEKPFRPNRLVQQIREMLDS